LQNIDRRRAANCKSANQPPKAHHPSDGGLQLSREAVLAPNGGFGDPIPGRSPALADAPPPEPLTVKIRTRPYFRAPFDMPHIFRVMTANSVRAPAEAFRSAAEPEQDFTGAIHAFEIGRAVNGRPGKSEHLTQARQFAR
jgi:hypothetical protein